MTGKDPTVSFLGLGYVGLCTSVAFATRQVRAIGIDIEQEKVKKIGNADPHFHEPQLKPLLKKTLESRMLTVTSDISDAARTDITFITVGTPGKPDGSIDLSYIETATRQLGSAIAKKNTYHLTVVKSTVIPGTTTSTVKPILERASGRTIGPLLGLCANPEFLKEGSAMEDTFHPDKIVIGANDNKSTTTLAKLYQRFYKTKLPPVLTTTPETAELIKYASNAFLATKVSYINTIANIAQTIPGVDVNHVAEAIGHDARIGPLFLKAGPGYGGSCFHKDLQALINYSQNNRYDPVLLRATEETNEHQADKVLELSERLVGPLRDKRVAVLGLAFKKDTDDIREAASIRVINQLRKKGARIVVYDPMAIPNAKKILENDIEFASDPRSAIKNADCCIIMTEWDEFRKLKAKDYLAHMRTPNLVDARRTYRPEELAELNFAGIGLGPIR